LVGSEMGIRDRAYMWAQMAKSASAKIAAGDADPYYVTKLQTGQYFVERILPDAAAHLVKLKTGAEVLMQMPAEAF
ncbi:acyl-CoA dehydrogenase C-terminal domain-containing protein, partial [uncultured Brevundimonas sp.]|uniref:acyl-CoA dehydrogenase C-terminal domain-containing protein n=1 Tax=uncultured Brevundimonas sp. TaxID=213418 RepID=UPI0026144C93